MPAEVCLQMARFSVNFLAAGNVAQMLTFAFFVGPDDWWQSRQFIYTIGTSTTSASSLGLCLSVILKLEAVGLGKWRPALWVKGRSSGRCWSRIWIWEPRFRVVVCGGMILMIWRVSVWHWWRSRLTGEVGNWIKIRLMSRSGFCALTLLRYPSDDVDGSCNYCCECHLLSCCSSYNC